MLHPPWVPEFKCSYSCKQMRLWIGYHVHFSISALGLSPTCNCAGLVHAATVPVSSHLHQSYCIWKTRFSCCHPSLLTLTIFTTLLPHGSLSPEGRGLMKTCRVELSVPRSQTLGFVQFVGLCLSSYLLQEGASLMMVK